MRIGIDLMGSETPPQDLFQAVKMAVEMLDPAWNYTVFATQSVIHQLSPLTKAPIQFHPVSDVITMGDHPLSAVRQKRGSSLIVGLRSLKKKGIQALVSTGNTGALVASAALSLPKLPGIKRPALLAELPTEKGPIVIVDVGGNVDCKALHMVQFAHMGVAYQRCTHGLEKPRVGLLNIGVESKKGTLEHRETYQLLENSPLHFLGNIEAREIFQGKVDVLVTDGFTGNVLVKSIEGVSMFILDSIRHLSQDASLLLSLKQQFHHEEYSGAIVSGIDGVVVKCHGNSSARAFFNGIKEAGTLVQRKFVEGLTEELKLISFQNSTE